MTLDRQKIYALVREAPKGEVASYGMIASLLAGVGPRQVGRALAEMPNHVKAPWHRIVQSSGAIAPRAGGSPSRQRELLKKEGVAFRKNGCVDWRVCRWRGPSSAWIAENGRDPEEVMEIIAGWRR